MRANLNYGLGLVLAITLLACGRADALPDDGFVDVPGGRIAFRVIGESEGIPVLIIHGGPGSRSCTYPSTFAGVAATRPVVMYDQLDSGHSDRMIDLKRDAVLSRFVAEVASIRAELGLREVHLVGQAWGVAVALEYLLTADLDRAVACHCRDCDCGRRSVRDRGCAPPAEAASERF